MPDVTLCGSECPVKSACKLGQASTWPGQSRAAFRYDDGSCNNFRANTDLLLWIIDIEKTTKVEAWTFDSGYSLAFDGLRFSNRWIVIDNNTTLNKIILASDNWAQALDAILRSERS